MALTYYVYCNLDYFPSIFLFFWPVSKKGVWDECLTVNNTHLDKAAMRRCGHNPTDIEVSDIINKIHDDTGSLNFEVILKFYIFQMNTYLDFLLKLRKSLI